MTRQLLLSSTLMLLLLAAQPAAAQFAVTVYPSIGPNGNGSPSILAYGANAIYALENGLSSYGAGGAGSPSFYSQVTGSVTPSSIISTGAYSWDGQAVKPGQANQPDGKEVGNALFFGFHAHSATPTTISSVTLTVPFPNAAVTATKTSFSPFLVGYNATTPGAGYFTSGALSSHAITDLYYAGASGAFVSTVAGLPATIASLLSTYAGPNGAFNLGSGASVSFGGATTTSLSLSASIATPEPASAVVLGLGVVGLLGYTYRRRRQAAMLSAPC
jgi:hypothetical protein